jgi:hypothetical protein
MASVPGWSLSLDVCWRLLGRLKLCSQRVTGWHWLTF